MRVLLIFIAGAVLLGSASQAAAQPYYDRFVGGYYSGGYYDNDYRVYRDDGRYDDRRYYGDRRHYGERRYYNNGRHYGWRNDRVRVCRWRNHHRYCYWVRRHHRW